MRLRSIPFIGLLLAAGAIRTVSTAGAQMLAARAVSPAGVRVTGVNSAVLIAARPGGLVEVVSTQRARGPDVGPPIQHVLFRATDIVAWAPHAADAARWYVSTQCRAEGNGSEQAGELWAVVPGVDSTTTDSVRDARRAAADNPVFSMHCFADHMSGRTVTRLQAGPSRGVPIRFASPAPLVAVVHAMRTQAERSAALDMDHASAATQPPAPVRGGLTSPAPTARTGAR
jgi:hypothetical protein